MAPKKAKPKQTTNDNPTSSMDNKYVLLRDTTSQANLIVAYSKVSTGKRSTLSVGTEVVYTVAGCDRGRGIILLIGTEVECVTLLTVLDNSDSPTSSKPSQSRIFIGDEAHEEDDQPLQPQSNQVFTDEILSEKTSACDTFDDLNVSCDQTVLMGDPVFFPGASSMTRDDLDIENTARVGKKRSSEANEFSASSKRSKSTDHVDAFSHSRYLSLQQENKKLKEKVDELMATWMPRPDKTTIAYFATIVDLCKGRDADVDEEKGEKLARIMDILLLNQAELDECVHSTSIRSTCRKVLRKVFKEELLDPNVHFAHILQNEVAVTAIRDFGRMMNPLESPKFTNGDLNNAMGSDFYQRDRLMKIRTAGMNKENEKDNVEQSNVEGSDS